MANEICFAFIKCALCKSHSNGIHLFRLNRSKSKNAPINSQFQWLPFRECYTEWRNENSILRKQTLHSAVHTPTQITGALLARTAVLCECKWHSYSNSLRLHPSNSSMQIGKTCIRSLFSIHLAIHSLWNILWPANVSRATLHYSNTNKQLSIESEQNTSSNALDDVQMRFASYFSSHFNSGIFDALFPFFPIFFLYFSIFPNFLSSFFSIFPFFQSFSSFSPISLHFFANHERHWQACLFFVIESDNVHPFEWL